MIQAPNMAQILPEGYFHKKGWLPKIQDADDFLRWPSFWHIIAYFIVGVHMYFCRTCLPKLILLHLC